jgi:PncC family amidohydrolase
LKPGTHNKTLAMIEKKVASLLLKKKLTLAVAESCTGGLVSCALTDIPGSSRYFLAGIVAYSNEAKIRLLGVSPRLIKEHGAVSKETAMAMAENVKRLTQAHIGIGITGIAGPTGGTVLKPVGTVFIAVRLPHHIYFKKFLFSGNRLRIKRLGKDEALHLLEECLT